MANDLNPSLPDMLNNDDDAVGGFETLLAKNSLLSDQKWMDGLINDAEKSVDQAPNPANNSNAQDQKPPAQNTDEPATLDDRMSPTAPQARAKPDGEGDDDDGEAFKLDWDGANEITSSIASDLLQGVIDAPGQILGGVIDAGSEMRELYNDIVDTGGYVVEKDENGEIVRDENGRPNYQYITPKQRNEMEQAAIEAFTPGDAKSVSGGFIRSTAQFLTAFIPAAKGLKAAGLTKSAFATGMTAGAISDAVAFDPFEDRLATYLNEIPALAEIVPDYLADTDPENQSKWEGRLKNAIEGAGIGLAFDGLMKGFRMYKARRAENGDVKPEPKTVAEQAARDRIIENSRADIVDEITDEAMAPLGNPDADELFINAGDDDTLVAAMERLGATKERVAQENVVTSVLSKIREFTERFKGDQSGASPLDDALDLMRKGKRGNEAAIKKMQARPAADALKGAGGAAPGSPFANELIGRGITPKTHPGMFKKGGIETADNIPRDDMEGLFGKTGDDATDIANESQYVSQDEWIDALEAEAGGNPFRTQDQLAEIEAGDAVGDLDQYLDELGIDWEDMDNAAVAARIKQIEDEAAQFGRAGEDVPDANIERSLDDLDVENAAIRQAEELQHVPAALRDGVDPNSNKKQSKIFINHARIREPDDVKNLIQSMADQDADFINQKRGGEKVSNAQQIKKSDKEYTDIVDLVGRDPGPMTAPQAIAARRVLNASAEQLMGLAEVAASDIATKSDLFNFRRAMVVHYAIQAEVIAARTETARALQSWSIFTGSTKKARKVVCAI